MSMLHSTGQVNAQSPLPALPPISLLGVVRTHYAAQPGAAIPQLVYEAVQAALADAGLTMRDVDARVTASVGLKN